MSAAPLMLEIPELRARASSVAGPWISSVRDRSHGTGGTEDEPVFMSRITPEDARAPGGVAGRGGKLTRSQFVRRLGTGLLGCGAAAAGLGSLAFPRRSHGALYQDGTTSAQTTNMGLQFQGKAISFRLYSPLAELLGAEEYVRNVHQQ